MLIQFDALFFTWVTSLSIILFFVFFLSGINKNALQNVMMKLIVSTMICNSSNIELSNVWSDKNVFARMLERKNLYGPYMLYILVMKEGIEKKRGVKKNMKKMAPLLALPQGNEWPEMSGCKRIGYLLELHEVSLHPCESLGLSRMEHSFPALILVPNQRHSTLRICFPCAISTPFVSHWPVHYVSTHTNI